MSTILNRKPKIKIFKYLPNNIVGIALYPFIFVRSKKYKENLVTINHEQIHLAQQKELLVIPFYILYIIEGLIKGYRNISFEKEAYNNETNLDYLKTRKPYASFRK